MKIKFIISIIIFGLLTGGCITTPAANQPIENNNQNQETVFDFNSCVAAGNPILKSKPAQCRHNGITYIEEIVPTPTAVEIPCQASQREAEVCAEIYQPVCATVNVQCIKAPCPPIAQTFSSVCHACRNALVNGYVTGECPTEKNTD